MSLCSAAPHFPTGSFQCLERLAGQLLEYCTKKEKYFIFMNQATP